MQRQASTSTVAIQYYQSPVGELILGDFNEQLCLCDWRFRTKRAAIDARISKGLGADFTTASTPLLENTIMQLKAYFNRDRKGFDLPLLFVGSPFQQAVWQNLLTVGYGKTATYRVLAKQLNQPKAVRAVAAANGANALAIIVPCHRIVGSNQKLVGYAGGLSAKQKLLTLEGATQLALF